MTRGSTRYSDHNAHVHLPRGIPFRNRRSLNSRSNSRGLLQAEFNDGINNRRPLYSLSLSLSLSREIPVPLARACIRARAPASCPRTLSARAYNFSLCKSMGDCPRTRLPSGTNPKRRTLREKIARMRRHFRALRAPSRARARARADIPRREINGGKI